MPRQSLSLSDFTFCAYRLPANLILYALIYACLETGNITDELGPIYFGPKSRLFGALVSIISISRDNHDIIYNNHGKLITRLHPEATWTFFLWLAYFNIFTPSGTLKNVVTAL